MESLSALPALGRQGGFAIESWRVFRFFTSESQVFGELLDIHSGKL